jgi:hypothetical protein
MVHHEKWKLFGNLLQGFGASESTDPGVLWTKKPSEPDDEEPSDSIPECCEDR